MRGLEQFVPPLDPSFIEAVRSPASAVCLRGVTEVGRRNLFENRAEFNGALLAEGAREAPLRPRPERTASCDSGPPVGCQGDDPAASILLGHADPHEPAFLERTQEVAERRAIHDEQPRKILNRARTDVAEPGQDGELVHAQAGGRESIVIEPRDVTCRLAKGGAVTDLGLDLGHRRAAQAFSFVTMPSPFFPVPPGKHRPFHEPGILTHYAGNCPLVSDFEMQRGFGTKRPTEA